MFYLGSTTVDDLYFDLTNRVLNEGTTFRPRNQVCVEVRPGAFSIENPRACIYLGKTRKLNYAFMAAETMFYLAGMGDYQHAEVLTTLAPNMKAFVNRYTQKFDGAYGKFFDRNLPAVVRKLKEDIHSRQAVASIWGPDTLHDYGMSKDVPCTIALQFLLNRDDNDEDRLDLVVNMRSNDLNWGFPYDVAAFCTIQCTIADSLGIKVGCYNHVAGSLHVYRSAPPGPPKVMPRSVESFISWPDVPETGYIVWTELKADAQSWCRQLHEFVSSGVPLSDFYMTLEASRDQKRARWWKYWGTMVRNKWLSFNSQVCFNCFDEMQAEKNMYRCHNCGIVQGKVK